MNERSKTGRTVEISSDVVIEECEDENGLKFCSFLLSQIRVTKPKVKISWKPVNSNKTKRNETQIKVDTCRALLPPFS